MDEPHYIYFGQNVQQPPCTWVLKISNFEDILPIFQFYTESILQHMMQTYIAQIGAKYTPF